MFYRGNKEIEGKPLITVGMTPLSTPGLVMMGDLKNRREEQKEIKGKPLIIVGKTQLSMPG